PLGTIIPNPSVVQNNIQDGHVYVARISETSTGCTSDAVMTVNVRPLPNAQDATVALCEDAVGSNTTTNVDLIGDLRFREAVTTIGNQLSWHASVADAEANVSPIVAPIASITGFQDVYARITHSTNPACPIIVRLRLQVNQLP